jgi:oligosaccharide repeat unit polymerase
MLFFVYFVLPLKARNDATVHLYFTDDQLIFAQFIVCLGVFALLSGSLAVNIPERPRSQEIIFNVPSTPDRFLFNFGVAIGIFGVLAFYVAIFEIGGFEKAYGSSYGGGWSESGWVREASVFSVSGLLLIIASNARKRAVQKVIFSIIFASPFLIHSFLGARRSPFFLLAISATFLWYASKGKRPSIAIALGGALMICLTMLFLVVNRDNIYLGSNANLNLDAANYLNLLYGEEGSSRNEGNEYIVSAGLINYANSAGKFYFMGRLATVLLIRPIPKQFWPTKYVDASKLFGVPDFETAGMYVNSDEFEAVMGWQPAFGAASALIADVWIEFWWFYLLVLYYIGKLYSYAWAVFVKKGSDATIYYGLLAGYSVFLVMQGMESIIVRYALTAGPLYIVRLFVRKQRPISSYSTSPSRGNKAIS